MSSELTAFLISSAITPKKIVAAVVVVAVVVAIIAFSLRSRSASGSS
jgi:hypothetical protein